MSEHVGFLPGLYRALFLPDKAFSGDDLYRAYRYPLVLLLIVTITTGSAFSFLFHENETMRALVSAESSRRLDGMMANLSEEDREQVAIPATINTGFTVARIIGLVFGTAFWFLFLLELWLLSILLMQFLGGEETPVDTKKHRRSQILALYCLIPLGFQEAVRGVVYLFKDSAAIVNVLTLEEYDEATRISFSVLHLIGAGELPGFFGFLVSNVTNPFILWSATIAVLGARDVFKVGAGKSTICVAIVLVIIGLQNQLFSSIQGLFGG